MIIIFANHDEDLLLFTSCKLKEEVIKIWNAEPITQSNGNLKLFTVVADRHYPWSIVSLWLGKSQQGDDAGTVLLGQIVVCWIYWKCYWTQVEKHWKKGQISGVVVEKGEVERNRTIWKVRFSSKMQIYQDWTLFGPTLCVNNTLAPLATKIFWNSEVIPYNKLYLELLGYWYCQYQFVYSWKWPNKPKYIKFLLNFL